MQTLAEAVCELFGGNKKNIKVIGIRHGEKIYETLLANEECAAVLKSPDWIWEGNRFYMLEPNREGICPANSEPVYRLYNNRYATHKDSNHRYTHDMKIVEEMQAQNWRFEGTAFCAPL